MRRRTALTLAGVLAAAGPVAAQPPTAPPPRAAAELTATYAVRNAAAEDVAGAVRDHLVGSGRVLRVAFDARTNALIVQGTPATHARVAELVAGLDAEPAGHHLQLLVVQVPRAFLVECGVRDAGDTSPVFTLGEREQRMLTAALRNARDRAILSRPQLWVVENQTGVVQVGTGGDANGLTVRVTPRQTADGKGTVVRAELQVRTPAPPAGPGGVIPVNMAAVQTTWVTPAGGTGLVAVPTTDAAGRPCELLLFVTPTAR